MKNPYDDATYLKNVEEITRLAGEIFDMEGSDVSTIQDIFDGVIENLE